MRTLSNDKSGRVSYRFFNRLATAATQGPEWGLSFQYDRFGNRTGQSVTKGAAPALSAAYNPATNRMVGQSYDNNGNLLSLPWNQTGVYDVENRLKEVNTGRGMEKYGYDPSNRFVIEETSSITSSGMEKYGYNPSNQRTLTPLAACSFRATQAARLSSPSTKLPSDPRALCSGGPRGGRMSPHIVTRL